MRYLMHFAECDGHGCSQQLEGDTARYLDDEFDRQGWTVIRGKARRRTKHYCPDCAEALEVAR